MKRGVFLAGAGAAWLAPRGACAALDAAALTAAIPAVTGVVARTMNPALPPLVRTRADERFAAASVIKLGIMLAVFRAYDAGTASPSTLVRTRAIDLVGGSDVLSGSPAGKAWTMDALVRAMIRQSDNAASNTLVTALGMGTINDAMHAAGMESTKLARHFADVVPAWRRNENVTTPDDVATLLFEIEKGAREGVTTVATTRSCRTMIEIMLGNDDGTKIVRGLPRGTPCAHKTGEVDGTRNDAAIVDPAGDEPYILVVLTRDVRDNGGTNAGIAALTRRIDAVLRPAR